MPQWKLPAFARAPALREIAPTTLHRFLAPYRDFWAQSGVPFPDGPPLPDAALTSVVELLLAPRPDVPGPLIRALHLVDDLVRSGDADTLLDDVSLARLGLGSAECTPAEFVMLAWLEEPERVERRHAERDVEVTRTYVLYRSRRGPATRTPTPADLRRAEAALDREFARRNRGTGARIRLFERDGAVVASVRHGDPLRRAEALRDGAGSAVCYQPVQYDLVVRSADRSGLRVAARWPWERELYRTTFGTLFADGPDAFVPHTPFTLDPLRGADESLFQTALVEGLESVRLRQVVVRTRGTPSAEFTVTGDDTPTVLAGLANHARTGDLRLAEFRFRFEGERRERAVVIRGPGHIRLSWDDRQSVTDEWLALRGFIRETTDAHDRPTPPVAKPRRVPHAAGREKRVA